MEEVRQQWDGQWGGSDGRVPGSACRLSLNLYPLVWSLVLSLSVPPALETRCLDKPCS